jgi:hypothetical protein
LLLLLLLRPTSGTTLSLSAATPEAAKLSHCHSDGTQISFMAFNLQGNSSSSSSNACMSLPPQMIVV